MAASVDSPSPSSLQGTKSLMGSSPALCSPSSDKRFWSSLRCRIDTLLDERNCNIANLDPNMVTQNGIKSERAKSLKEDSLLLLRGFDSAGHTLSQLSNTIDNALQGARDLAKPPTLTEIFQTKYLMKKNSEVEEHDDEDSKGKENDVESKTGGMKRKYDISHCLEEAVDDSDKENPKISPKDKKLKKVKNIAVTMATKAASLARDLKSLKSSLQFVQERCGLLEEENRRLRDGFTRGIRPEEDDLVRLQLEALLAEKSRLANENGNLVRENQCLHQLVEYHQVTSEDLSASYEQVIHGLCLDFSSPPPSIPEGETLDDRYGNDEDKVSQTPRTDLFSFSTTFCDEKVEEHQ